MAIILITIGLLFTGVDVLRGTDWAYPAFQVAGSVDGHELSPSIRIYTITNVLGDHVRIDYLSDIIGCVLILIGVCMLLRYNKQYFFSIPFIVLTMVFSVLLRVCGYIEQGPELVVWVLALYYFLAVSELLMEYFVLYATVGITDTLVNQGTNTRLLFGWWITVICRTFIVFLNFVGHFKVADVYQVVTVLATIFFGYHLIRTKKYVGTCEPVKIGERRKRDKKEKL